MDNQQQPEVPELIPSPKTIAFAVSAFVVLICLALGAGFLFYASQPLSDDTRTAVIDVKPGMSVNQVSQTLVKNNLIASPRAFRFLSWITGKQGQIQVGEYELSPALSPWGILDKLASGKTFQRSVTIPEGYRLTQIAAALADKGLVDEEKFLQETGNRELVASLNIPTESLEGYLFPETYHFSKHLGEGKIIRIMAATFKERVLNQEIQTRAREMGLTLHAVITLASLIEKETGLESERELISAVFHNRLRKRMLLQTDPAVIYAISDFDGNLRKKDLSVPTPYNTYMNPGLPPGPIASPGLESILATLYPADSPYLYFVSRQDGSHHFSVSLAEHNHAVNKYQLRHSRHR